MSATAPVEWTLEDLADGNVSTADLDAIYKGLDLAETLQGIPDEDLPAVLDAIQKLTPADFDEALLKASKKDFACFLKYEMGLEVARHHAQWCEEAMSGEDFCIMAPRDHGKSLTLVRAYAIWKAKYDPHCREIYILGADQDSAIENLTKIKELLLSLRSLRDLMPVNVKQGLNNKMTLRMRNGTLLRAKSFFTALRGRHPQLIILDDVLNEINSNTEKARQQVISQYGSVVVPMKDKGTPKMRAEGYKGGQIGVIGTAQSAEDLYHVLLGMTEKNGPGPSRTQVRGMKQSAILVDEDWEPILDAGGSRQALWPERYTVAELDARKAEPTIGTLIFEREYMNKPIVDEMAIFPPSLFKPLLDRTLSYEPAYAGDDPTYMGVDFSVPGNMDGDYTVAFVIRYDPVAKRWTPLNYWRKRPNEVTEQLHQIEYMAQAYRVQLGYLEANVFQKMYADEFNKRTNLPVQALTTTGELKNSYLKGVLGLRPLFELGSWSFPYATDRDRELTDTLIREFGGIVQKDGKLGNEAGHDDIPMALWMAWRACMDNFGGGGFSADWSWS